MEIGNRVAGYRQKSFSEQGQFAAYIRNNHYRNFSGGTLSQAEHGQALPSPELLISLDRANLATPDDVFFGVCKLPVCYLATAIDNMSQRIFTDFVQVCSQICQKHNPDSVELSETYWWECVTLREEIERLNIDHEANSENLRQLYRQLKLNEISDCSRRFREIRKMKGLSQSEVANLLGVDINTVSTNERNTDLPRSTYLQRFCESLNVSATYLLGCSYALPKRLLPLQTLLSDYSYRTQELLVTQFGQAAKNIVNL